jgi:hypothetical protein
MSQGRCLFAATVLGNFIYAYGGITSSKNNKPTLVDKLVERYDTAQNKWVTIVVENAPSLAAFGWTLGPKEGEILVLGGSTGLDLTSELWSIDLKGGKATNTGIEYESATSLSKLSTYEPNDKSFLLFSFGGAQSNGSCYSIDLKTEKPTWQPLESNYASLFGTAIPDMGLLFNTAVEFST